jgi:hypothetical protein
MSSALTHFSSFAMAFYDFTVRLSCHFVHYSHRLPRIPVTKQNMNGFKIITEGNEEIRFEYYRDAAPVTCDAFARILPFTRTFHHARVSGEEIWIDDVPEMDIIQENASVFTEPGEVVFGLSKPLRTRTANCMGVYYGNGRGLDAANIFARVVASDAHKLAALGNRIWKNGSQQITFIASQV